MASFRVAWVGRESCSSLFPTISLRVVKNFIVTFISDPSMAKFSVPPEAYLERRLENIKGFGILYSYIFMNILT